MTGMRKLFFAVCGLVASSALGGSTAYAQNANLTVYLRAAGSGTFNKTSSTTTQVKVYAVSGLSAKYNGGTNLYAPTGMAASGSAFNLAVPSLYSPAAAPGNTYQIQLTWKDNADKQLNLGPITLAPGANNLGSGGLGTTTPIDITNDPPPAAQNLNCYADLPDKSTQVYTSWKGVLMANAKDLARTELHVSTTAGFTPSAATLMATPPYGTDYRKLTSLKPETNYYFCVRVIDNYGAYTDACRALPCTTEKSAALPDGGTATDAGSSGDDGGGAVTDGGGTSEDAGAVGDDGGITGEDGGTAGEDGGSGGTDDLAVGGEDGGTGQPQPGTVAVGCGCSLTTTTMAPGALSLLPALALLIRRRRRDRK